MAADRYRTQTLVIVALAALFICAGSITAGVFVYDRLQARANPTPAAGVQALSAQGLLVTAVVPGSPADGALQRGDILLQAADRPLRTPRDLQLELTALPPDSPLALTLLRGTATLALTIPLSPNTPGLGVELLAPREASFATPTATLPTATLPPGDQLNTTLPRVARVIAGSPAAAADIAPGDVVTAVDNHAILNMAELVSLIQARQPGETVSLTLRRGPDTLSRTLTLAPNPDVPARPYLGVELTTSP